MCFRLRPFLIDFLPEAIVECCLNKNADINIMVDQTTQRLSRGSPKGGGTRRTILRLQSYLCLSRNSARLGMLRRMSILDRTPERVVIVAIWRINREVEHGQSAVSGQAAPMLHVFSSYRQRTCYPRVLHAVYILSERGPWSTLSPCSDVTGHM
jgi:hypothetical protein